MIHRMKRSFPSRHHNNGDEPLPERKYQAEAQGWMAKYDIVGDRVIGSLFGGSEVTRRTFKVKMEGGVFSVDNGAGDGVKVTFIHKRNQG